MLTKLRFKFELILLYLKRNLLPLSVFLLLTLLSLIFKKDLFSLYHYFTKPTQKIGLEGLYKLQNLPPQITQKISYGLTTATQNYHFTTSPLVKKIDINSDHTEYKFELNPDLYWHRGKKFTASDVNYQIPGLTFTYDQNNQLKVTLPSPYAPILSTLSTPLIKKNFDALGPYQVAKYSYQDGNLKSLFLKSDKDNYLYRFYQSEADLINAFKVGEVDQIEISQVPDYFQSWPKTQITKNIHTEDRYIAIFINTAKFDNKQLRQALAYATPKSNDLNERALSPISPNSWAYNPDVKEYNLNPSRAKEFFEKNKIETISLVYNDQRLVDLAAEIKKSWESILGLKVDIQTVTQVNTDNFDTVLAFASIPPDPDQYPFWHSTQSKTNLTKLNNPRIDKLLEEGRQSFDQQERKKIYHEFQKNLLEECPAIFLKYPVLYTLKRDI